MTTDTEILNKIQAIKKNTDEIEKNKIRLNEIKKQIKQLKQLKKTKS